MTGSTFYHTGVLVNDLNEGVARFESLLGIHFGPVRTLDLADSEFATGPTRRTLRYVYSVEGPPYLELIEAQPDGLWGRQHGEGLHHIGRYEPKLAERVSELSESLVKPQALLRLDGELRGVYFDEANAHGVRIELVRPA